MRITRKVLDAKVSIINGMLGYGPDPKYPTPGTIVLYGAYGGWGVHRIVNDRGGQSDLMGGCQTAREADRFLYGMIHALRIVGEAR